MHPGASDDTHAHGARKRSAWTTRPGGRTSRARGTRSSCVLCGLLVVAVVSTRWVRVNVSPSAPSGLYRLAPITARLPRGTLVLLPVPASIQAWHWWFVPLLKPVAGVAGDAVCHRDQTLFVNGIDFGPVYQEAHGRPLPQLDAGCFVVPEGQVFLVSPTPRSLDARYFGPVPRAALSAQAFPLWTWR